MGLMARKAVLPEFSRSRSHGEKKKSPTEDRQKRISPEHRKELPYPTQFGYAVFQWMRGLKLVEV